MTPRQLQRCARLLSQYSGQSYMQCLQQLSIDDVVILSDGKALPIQLLNDWAGSASLRRYVYLLQKANGLTDTTTATKAAHTLGVTRERARLVLENWNTLGIGVHNALKAGFRKNEFGALQSYLETNDAEVVTLALAGGTVSVNGEAVAALESSYQAQRYIGHLYAMCFPSLKQKTMNIAESNIAGWHVVINHNMPGYLANKPSAPSHYLTQVAKRSMEEDNLSPLFVKTEATFTKEKNS